MKISLLVMRSTGAACENTYIMSEIITGDGIRVISDCRFFTESLCYKLEVWNLKDMGNYQAGKV